MPEAVSLELRCHRRFSQHGVVAFLGCSRRDVADGLQQPATIEPVDPDQGGELDGLEASPLPARMDHFCCEESVYRLGENVVVGVSDSADLGFDAFFRRSFSDALLLVNRRDL